jgi:hypothetical protein
MDPNDSGRERGIPPRKDSARRVPPRRAPKKDVPERFTPGTSHLLRGPIC